MMNAQISIFAFYAARIILGLLFVISVFSIAFFIERMIFFRKRLIKDATKIFRQIDKIESQAELAKVLSAYQSAETNVILQALKGSPGSNEAFSKRVDGFFYTERENWSRYSTFLGSVGSNAPFIGLLGTVFGILKAFADLSLASSGGPQVVMAGISEALVATAVGLLVAIPAVVFFNICKVRVKKSVVHLQSMVALICSKDLFNQPPLVQSHSDDKPARFTSFKQKINMGK